MKSRIKKIVSFLKVWDGVWSVPLALFGFLLAGWAIVAMYGPEIGWMQPVYFQRLLYAALCMVVFNFCSLFGLYMNFRRLFKYMQDESNEDFDKLTPIQKAVFTLSIYFGYIIILSACLILV